MAPEIIQIRVGVILVQMRPLGCTRLERMIPIIPFQMTDLRLQKAFLVTFQKSSVLDATKVGIRLSGSRR